ncbi:RF-1 domain-containing protein [Panaeolus papilionaceus]|nr:RF-1 domain-containing protein [Panaeolus papilionaceus]
MSLTPTLRAASRAAYRNVLRAASVTFSAFKHRIRSDITQNPPSTPEAAQERIAFVREVADVLRKNIVQGTKVSKDGPGDAIYRIRMTKDTELGDNDSIKNPPPMEPINRRRRKSQPSKYPVDVARASFIPAASATPNSSIHPLNFSALKKAHRNRNVPELKEDDLEEKFVRGSGPGGQSINKTENCVQLLHKPTGLRVTCQETRSLSQNRQFARKWLLEKASPFDPL